MRMRRSQYSAHRYIDSLSPRGKSLQHKMHFCAFLLASVAFSGELVSDRTNSIHNGRWWRVMDSSMQLAYVIGLNDGLSYAEKPDAKADFWWPGLSYGEIRQALNQYYDEPANIRIPIRDAIVAVALKVKGLPKADLDQFTEMMRRRSAEAGK
jgi:hypothetical protein